MKEKSNHDIVIAIGSRNFFGAERRFFKIANYLNNQKDKKLRFYLVINYSLYASALKIEWARDILSYFEGKNRLLILPDNINNIFFLKGFFSLLKIIFSEKFRAILHGRILAIPRLMLKKDTIFEVTSIDEAKHILKRYPKFLLSRVALFNCVSKTVANDFSELIKNYGYLDLLNKIRNDSFPFFISKEQNYICEEKKEKIIVFGSRFIERKNPIIFTQACYRLLNELPDWKVYICGKGPLEDEINQIIKKHIDNGRAKVFYSTNLEAILSKSAIYVSLIEPDNYPSQSILEAMFYKNSLLLSNTGTSSRFINLENRNGYLSDLDVNNVYEKLKYMCTEFDETIQMGANSKDFLLNSFSAEKYIEKFLAITMEEDKQ